MNPEQPSLLSFQHVTPEFRLFQGDGSLDALKRELHRSGARRAVVICGRTISRSDAMDLLRNSLGASLVGVCDAAREHSPLQAVNEAAQFLDEHGADSVIAVGGGSAAVTARAASILLAEKKPAQELCTRRLPDGSFESPRVNALKLPQFVVPTTPSTAFVKGGSAVHDDSGQRLALFDPKTRPRGIFVHPYFLGTAPEGLVQSASLNTLANAVEGLESLKCDPISEAMLRHSLRLVGSNLSRLSIAGSGARERLVIAAILCGRGTEQGGGGLASVLAHAIGHRTHTANGIVNAIVLPHTMRFNAPVTLHGSEAIIDSLWSTNEDARRREGAALVASDLVESLLAKLPVPHRLREIGVGEGDLAEIAKAAMSDWFIGRNSRVVPDVSTVLSILQAAW